MACWDRCVRLLGQDHFFCDALFTRGPCNIALVRLLRTVSTALCDFVFVWSKLRCAVIRGMSSPLQFFPPVRNASKENNIRSPTLIVLQGCRATAGMVLCIHNLFYSSQPWSIHAIAREVFFLHLLCFRGKRAGFLLLGRMRYCSVALSAQMGGPARAPLISLPFVYNLSADQISVKAQGKSTKSFSDVNK